MAERVTSFLAEYLVTVPNNARVTTLLAEYLYQNPNNARVTTFLAEYLYKEFTQSSGKSAYFKDWLVNGLFRSADFSKKASLFVGLLSAVPDTTNPDGIELTGSGYARVEVDALDTNWSAPSAGNGTTSNLVTITFPAPTAPWVQTLAYAIYDGGGPSAHWLYYATLSAAASPTVGSNPRFLPGAIQIVLN